MLHLLFILVKTRFDRLGFILLKPAVKLKVLFMLCFNSIRTVSSSFLALNQGGGHSNIESIKNVRASELIFSAYL